jgi:hypothetical protein
MLLSGLWNSSAKVLFPLMLVVSLMSRLLWLPGTAKCYSFLWGGEAFDWMRFLSVALMGTKVDGPSRDSLMPGDVPCLELRGERCSYLRGETMRCSLTNFC